MRTQLDQWLARNPMPLNKEARREYYARMPADVDREWQIRKAAAQADAPEFNSALCERASKRMDRVDAFPPDIRAVIYEHGLEIVQEFWNHGVRKAKSIKHLIDTAQGNDFSTGQARFALNRSPKRASNPFNKPMVSVPLEPTGEMIAASMAEVSTFSERITKHEKHRRRLRAALQVVFKEQPDAKQNAA